MFIIVTFAPCGSRQDIEMIYVVIRSNNAYKERFLYYIFIY